MSTKPYHVYCAILSYREYCDILCRLGCHNKLITCHTISTMTYYAYCAILNYSIHHIVLVCYTKSTKPYYKYYDILSCNAYCEILGHKPTMRSRSYYVYCAIRLLKHNTPTVIYYAYCAITSLLYAIHFLLGCYTMSTMPY